MKIFATAIIMLLPGLLCAQQAVITPGTHPNIITMSTDNGVIHDSNLWDFPVFPNGAIGQGSNDFGSMSFAPDNVDFAGGSIYQQAGPQLHFRLSRAYCDKTSTSRQSVDDQKNYFCVPDAVTIDDSHPASVTPNKNLIIAPYNYGMGITYPGVVEFISTALSVHTTDQAKGAHLWVGDNHDVGGILLSGYDVLSPDGTIDRSQSYVSITSRTFGGGSHGDMLFSLRDPQDTFRFQVEPVDPGETPSAYQQYTAAKIDSSGKGFFNGGTQTGGADFAESVSVAGPKGNYEPGDVLMIDPDSDRQVTLAHSPYSTLVAGIYSTKPGVLATLHTSEDLRIAEEVPVAIVGIVPCKVTNENGPIHRGDLLVTSSTPGHAMRGSDASIRSGTVIGKALQNFSGVKGKIEVLVMPR